MTNSTTPQLDRLKAHMDQDYLPAHPTRPSVEDRIANALEYMAYQLGQINRKLDKLGVKLDEPPKSS